MGIQRYDADTKYIGTGDYAAIHVKADDGDVVDYEDHLATLAAKDGQIEALIEAAMDTDGQLMAAAEQIARLKLVGGWLKIYCRYPWTLGKWEAACAGEGK